MASREAKRPAVDDDLDRAERLVEIDRSLPTVVIVDGLPIVPATKYGALQKYLRGTFQEWGAIVEDGLYMPVDGPTGKEKTLGFAFVEYSSPDEAIAAIQLGDKYELDEDHILRVNLFEDYDKYTEHSDEYEPPKRDEFQVASNLQSWLQDELGRDQFVLRFGKETHIYWNDPLRQPGNFGRVLKYGGEREKAGSEIWTQLYVQWSPRGSYLATFHAQGIAIWGGDGFEKLSRMKHPDVKLIDWSPMERYIVTTNGEDKQFPHDPDCITVWDVRTGKELRGFDKGVATSWPTFKWSHDDKYVARIAEDLKMVLEAKVEAKAAAEAEAKAVERKVVAPAKAAKAAPAAAPAAPLTKQQIALIKGAKAPEERDIKMRQEKAEQEQLEKKQQAERHIREKRLMISIYETPTMNLLDKKSIKIEGVQDIQWSPSHNIMAYWVNERDNAPARVVLLEVPSKRVIREKHLYNVADIRLTWQSDGDFLCVKVMRRTTKKKVTTNFEIFCLRERDIPVEVVEVTDTVSAFAWEPHGQRFAIIHNDGVKALNTVSFFGLKRNKLKPLGVLKDKTTNNLFWSPQGNYIVLATLGGLQSSGSNGQLEFFDVANQETVAIGEHFLCTDVEWDPSGRYVLTASTQAIGASFSQESGYKVWSLQGTLLVTCAFEALYQTLWRPRPPSLVSKSKEKEIRASLVAKDKMWRQFVEEDAKLAAGHNAELKVERLRLKNEWKAYRAEREKDYQDEAELLSDLRGCESDDDDDYIFVDQEVEEVVEETVEDA